MVAIKYTTLCFTVTQDIYTAIIIVKNTSSTGIIFDTEIQMFTLWRLSTTPCQLAQEPAEDQINDAELVTDVVELID